MAESTAKTPGLFDPEALLAAQRRNAEAFTSAGKIVAVPPSARTRRISSRACVRPSTGSWRSSKS